MEYTYKHGETTFIANPELSDNVLVITHRFDQISVPRQDLVAFADATRWISVKERLPDPKLERILTCNAGERPALCFCIFRPGEERPTWRDNGYGYIQEFTHWMPLPKPPRST